ncbi:MAG: SH3 domain-containing protein [Treponema sp.]|nr:SH3 domain-containing protein [Treponema sp.]
MKKIILICIMLLVSVIPGFSYFVELEYSSMFWEQDASLVVSRFMCLVDNQLLVLNRRIPYGRGFSELVLVSNFNIQRVLSVPLRSDDDELAGLYKTRQKDRILIEIYTNDGESYFCDYFISQQQGTLTDKLDTSMLDDSPYVTKVDSSNFPVKLSDDHLYLVQEGAPADLQIIAFWTYLNTVGVVYDKDFDEIYSYQKQKQHSLTVYEERMRLLKSVKGLDNDSVPRETEGEYDFFVTLRNEDGDTVLLDEDIGDSVYITPEKNRVILCSTVDFDIRYKGFGVSTGSISDPHVNQVFVYRIVDKATVNDNRVRLRTEPNLTSQIVALLESGYQVKIKDKSEEPQTIDGESWYWYKVESEGYPEGWVYGKYLDIKE